MAYKPMNTPGLFIVYTHNNGARRFYSQQYLSHSSAYHHFPYAANVQLIGRMLKYPEYSVLGGDAARIDSRRFLRQGGRHRYSGDGHQDGFWPAEDNNQACSVPHAAVVREFGLSDVRPEVQAIVRSGQGSLRSH